MVPHISPAARAAITPEKARAEEIDPEWMDAADSITALATIAMAPPSTLVQFALPAPFSS